MHTKYVSSKEVKVGDIVQGYRLGTLTSMCTAKIKGKNPFKITITMWPDSTSARDEDIDASALFKVEMAEEEFRKKYNKQAKELMLALKNKMVLDEIGYHEMWNAWIDFDPWEMAEACIKNNIRVLGISSDIPSKANMFSGKVCDIGVCAEYIDNGERFWCHWFSSSIEDMFEAYRYLIEENKINS